MVRGFLKIAALLLSMLIASVAVAASAGFLGYSGAGGALVDGAGLWSSALDGMGAWLGSSPVPLLALPLLVLHLIYRWLWRRRRRAPEPPALSETSSPAKKTYRQVRRKTDSGQDEPPKTDTARPFPEGRGRRKKMARLRENLDKPSRAPVILALSGAAMVVLMIVLVSYLYFGPGHIDLGPNFRIQRGPKKTFFLRIGAVFGAVVLLHVVYFLVFVGGGTFLAKQASGKRGPRRRRKRRPRKDDPPSSESEEPIRKDATSGAAAGDEGPVNGDEARPQEPSPETNSLPARPVEEPGSEPTPPADPGKADDAASATVDGQDGPGTQPPPSTNATPTGEN